MVHAGDPDGVGVPHGRDHPGCLVELRGPRMGWLLGMGPGRERLPAPVAHRHRVPALRDGAGAPGDAARLEPLPARSEEHTSELQSLMRISYAVFCLKKKNIITRMPTQLS